MSDKKYLNSLIIKGRVNQFGEEELKVSGKVEELIQEIRDNAKGDWINLVITKRKQVSEKGVSHSTLVDVWEKKEAGQQAVGHSAPAYASDEPDELPF